jgi:hypothetical protein
MLGREADLAIDELKTFSPWKEEMRLGQFGDSEEGTGRRLWWYFLVWSLRM